MKSWHWYSRDHALAAVLLCRKCAELEQDPAPPGEDDEAKGFAWSSVQATEHRTYAMTAVLTAFAFLEASVNELLESAAADEAALDVGGSRGELTNTERAALADLQRAWDGRTPSLLDRAQLILHLLRRPPFNKADAPYQPADELRRLRNALVHHRLEWRAVGGGKGDDKIARNLASLSLPPHPFATPGHPFFPDRCLGQGLAFWAWNTSLTFTDAFFARVRVTPIYDDLRPQLTLEQAS